ncbi:hypothetical protein ACFE04_017794 [Oxalis oulophora]
MASDESMAMISATSMHELDEGDEYTDHDIGYGTYDHHVYHHHGYDFHHTSHTHNNLSRLSMCTSSINTNDDDDGMNMFMSKLSMESFDCDADEEYSDEKMDNRNGQVLELSSLDDSDKEQSSYSLPATPRCRRAGGFLKDQLVGAKDYASENELRKDHKRKNLRKRKSTRQQSNICVATATDDHHGHYSDQESENGGVMVITRPKGGSRSLCMDMEEVRACKDLGFELQHERMFPSGRISRSGSTLDTASSGGDSPIASWRISSPGDNPRDVKARLKVWAQAVALASTSRHGH